MSNNHGNDSDFSSPSSSSRFAWRRGARMAGVLAFVALAAAVACGQLQRRGLIAASPRIMGAGPAGASVPAAPFADGAHSMRPVVLLGLGDSITAGFGVEEPYNYFSLLADNPPDEFPDMRGKNLRTIFPNLSTDNRAVNGSTSLHHADTVFGLTPWPKEVFGMVVMTTGGNDIIHSYGRIPPAEGAMYGATLAQAEPWIGSFRTRLDAMLEGIRAAFPGGCVVFLADIYDPTDGVGDIDRYGMPAWPDGLKVFDGYNRVLREAALRHDHVVAVPVHMTFLGHGAHYADKRHPAYRRDDPTHWYHENVEDPNRRGYDALRRIFLNTIVDNREQFLNALDTGRSED